jgi:uncharacterized protein YdaU (DUF1376 family)
VKKADTWMPFYVGDYLADTMLLTTVQHGAYLLLMLACWKAGGALPDDDDALASASKLSSAEWKRNGQALRRFFEARDGLLFHKRISAELEKAQGLSDKRSAAGKLGGRPAKTKQEETNRFPFAEANAKQNETPSPSPNTSSLRSEVPRDKRAAPVPCPAGVDAQVWADWRALRKAKRAPVSQTVLDEASREAAKAGLDLESFLRVWVARGSQGLQADWLKPNERRQPAASMSFHERDQAAKAARVAEFAPMAAQRRQPGPEVIDITPRIAALE